MNRRRFLRAVPAVALTGLGGCLASDEFGGGTERENAVGLVLENGSDADRAVSTEITDLSDDTVFSGEYDVPAGERVSEESILPAGRYTVHVAVEEVGEATYQFRMDGCNENTIVVEFDESVHVRTGCHDD